MNRKIVSGLVLTTLLVCTLTLVFNVKLLRANGTIYITAGGSVEGTDRIERFDDVYTFTGDINDSIVIRRDNMILDGDGHALVGTIASEDDGVALLGRSNVTIKNLEIRQFRRGILLRESKICQVYENHITSCESGIVVLGGTPASLYSQIIFGNTLTHNSEDAIIVVSSNGNEIIENNIEANLIIENNITGIHLVRSSNNLITDNNITGSLATNNNSYGIVFTNSSNNNVSGNSMAYNSIGAYMDGDSSKSSIYYNDFTNNEVQAVANGLNDWDNDTLKEGNYWSDYEGIDQNGDGIGDTLTPHHDDRYPFIGPLSPIPVLHQETIYYCSVDNSITVSRFSMDKNKTLSLNIIGEGYVNLTIPRKLLDGSFQILFSNAQIPYKALWDKDYNFIYFEHVTSVPISVRVEAQMKLQGDLNSDEIVNIRDIFIVAKNFGKTLED